LEPRKVLPLSGGTPQKYEEWAVVDTEKITYSSASSCNKMWISGLLFSLSGSVHLANRSFTLSFLCLLLSSCTRLWLSFRRYRTSTRSSCFSG